MLEPGPYLILGVLLGIIGGWLFQRLWRRLLPLGASRAFWTSLPQSLRAMLETDEASELFRHYRSLLVATARYSFLNTCAVLVAAAPIAGIFFLLDALDPSGRLASNVEIHPAAALALPVRSGIALQTQGPRLLIDRDALGDSAVQLAGWTLTRDELAEKLALCRTTITCLAFEAMLFETHAIDSAERTAVGSSVIVRPAFLDANPFWPYLNDLDLSLFVAVMSGGAAAALRSRFVKGRKA